MVATKFTTELRNAGGEDFVAVFNEAGHGCDVYAGGEVFDWQDGNGILAHDEASEAEVRKAVVEIDYINGSNAGSGYDIYGYMTADGQRMAVCIKDVASDSSVFVAGFQDTESFQACLKNYANGGDIPSESDDGAESEWDQLHAIFGKQ
jgi:hypothetical protein